MSAPTNIIDQLRRDEGEVLHAYQDSLGFWTIGVGVLLDSRKGGGISRDESAMLLQNRVDAKEQQLAAALPWTAGLDPVRRAALLNMSYNLGVPGLLKFETALAHIKHGNWQSAHDALLESLWARQVGIRAQRLAAQILTGEWQ